jgi:hypothetical protein
MEREEFAIYMARFEVEVLMKGWKEGRWGKEAPVPVRPKGVNTLIGKLVGSRFLYPEPAAIYYYSFFKKSTGFMTLAATLYSDGYRLAQIHAPIVSIGAPGMEDVLELAPDLVADFARFKQVISDVVSPKKTQVCTTTAP